MIHVNLLPASRVAAARARRAASRWMLLGSAYTGALLLICGAVGASGGTELSAAQARARDVEDRFERAERARAEAGARLTAATTRASVAQALDEHADLADLLRVVAATPAPEIALVRIRVASEQPAPATKPATGRAAPGTSARGLRYTLHIEGLAPTTVDASHFAIALESLGLFDSVRQQSSGSERLAGSNSAGVRFTVECVMADRKGAP